MKNILFRSVLLVLSLVMVFSMFTACGKQAEPSTDAIVDAAVKAALDAVATTTSVTIDADGKQVTIEDAAGKTIRQLLEQAGVALNDGDILSLSPDQTITGSVALKVMRKYTVTITVEETGENVTITGFDGTVADVLAQAGIELAEYHTLNFEQTQALENGMEIIVSGEEEPEETEPTEPEKKPSGGSSSGGSSSSGSSSESKPKPKPEETKTVVSVQYYDDCDGSGHGVKVITYSDGTQVEVPY